MTRTFDYSSWSTVRDRLTCPAIRNGALLSKVVELHCQVQVTTSDDPKFVLFQELVETLSTDTPDLRWAVDPVMAEPEATDETV